MSIVPAISPDARGHEELTPDLKSHIKPETSAKGQHIENPTNHINRTTSNSRKEQVVAESHSNNLQNMESCLQNSENLQPSTKDFAATQEISEKSPSNSPNNAEGADIEEGVVNENENKQEEAGPLKNDQENECITALRLTALGFAFAVYIAIVGGIGIAVLAGHYGCSFAHVFLFKLYMGCNPCNRKTTHRAGDEHSRGAANCAAAMEPVFACIMGGIAFGCWIGANVTFGIANLLIQFAAWLNVFEDVEFVQNRARDYAPCVDNSVFTETEVIHTTTFR